MRRYGTVLIFVTLLSGCGASPQPENQKPETQIPRPASSRSLEENAARAYLGAAASYLTTGNAQATRAAQGMVDVSTGKVTLTELKEILKGAAFVENAGYYGDYQAKIKQPIPAAGITLSRDISEVHRLFQSGTKEILQYWADQNSAHVDSGSQTFKASFQLMNKCIEDVAAEMKKLPK